MRKKTLLVFCAFLVLFNAIAQTNAVTGKVTDDKGLPVQMATISTKKSKKVLALTGNDGTFKASIPASDVLVISAVGYITQEVPANDNVSVALKTDVNNLAEVVVTGVGIATSKKRLGIAVESISSDKLPQTPTASIDQALIGKVPGAQISSVSGNPGDPVNIVLRGINTLQGGTRPLIIMDGVEVRSTDLNSLDLSNIDRVEIVQGAASATLYGAQGANGVIQIFTKKGKKGATSVNYNTSYSFNNFLNNGHVHKADKHGLLTDANNNIINYVTGQPVQYDAVGSIDSIAYQYGGDNGTPGPGRYYILDTNNVDNKPYNANLKYYDHFKQVFQTGYTFNNSISISGAGDKSDYALTVSNNHTVSPILKNGYVDRTNLSANIGTELFKGFKIRSITELIYTKNTLHPQMGAGAGLLTSNGLGSTNRVYGFLNTSPFFDLSRKLSDGTYPFYQTADFLSVNATNPFYQDEYTDGNDNKVDIIQNFDADYTVNRFVELDAKYGINYDTRNARYTYYNQSENLNSNYYAPNFTGNYAQDNTGEINNYQVNSVFQNFLATAYIRTDFQKDFNINLPIQTSTELAYDYRKNQYKEYDSYGLGLPLVPPINLQSTSTQAVSYDYVEPFITYGYLINQKIDFGDYGGITGGFRSDYSSAFGEGSKPFTFPHFDGHVLLNSFFGNGAFSNAIPYLKIRAAYGEAGIQPGTFQRYPTLTQQNLGTSLVYTLPTTNLNPDLHVEVTKETEIGTDFSINLNKNGNWLKAINGSFSYWTRKSSNVIFTVSIPPSTGASSFTNNAIDLSSHGYQFSVNIPIANTRNFNWDFTTNYGHQVSVIDRINGPDIILTSAAANADASIVLTPGHKIGEIYGYKALTSLDYTHPDGTRYIAKEDEGNYEIVDGRVVDKRTYQIQFTQNKYPLGDPNPKFNVSFINSLSYKGIVTLSFQFDWVYGSHLYNQTKEWMYRDGISGDFTKPVTIDGRTGAFTAYWSSPYYNIFGSTHGADNDGTRDFFYENASFLRLRNLSLGFDLAKLLNVSYFKRCQLILTGRNILTVTKYTGYDPEISSGGANSAFDRGVDQSTLPNIKSYQVGLNIGF